MIIHSALLKIVQTLMRQFPARKLNNLSSTADFIDYMIPHTNVNFRMDQGNPRLETWEDDDKWLDTVTKRFPLHLDLLDHVLLVVREAGGAALTAPVIAALGSISVGAGPKAGVQLLTLSPTQVVDPNGVATIAGLYQFQNRTHDMGGHVACVHCTGNFAFCNRPQWTRMVVIISSSP